MGPRLKTCAVCATLNAPRQFYCTNCNTGFYSEEKLANRALAKQEECLVEENLVSKAEQDFFLARIGQKNFIDYSDEKTGKEISVNILSLDDRSDKIAINPWTSVSSIDSKFLNVTQSVAGLAWSAEETLAVLSGHRTVSLWKDGLFLKKFETFHDSTFLSWVTNLSSESVTGILLIGGLKQITLVQIDAKNCQVFWSSSESPFFMNAAARFNGSSIELLIARHDQEAVEFVSLNAEARAEYSQTFSYPICASCVNFLAARNFFVVGYADGQVALWDLRNAQSGPVNVTSTLGGIRRWLVELVPCSFDSQTVFAAFQTGAVVHLGREILPVGGDPKGTQCWSVSGWGTRIFAAMNSGVVVTMDTSLRDKLRRPMTSWTSQWEHDEADANDFTKNDGDLTDLIFKTYQTHPVCESNIWVRLFGPAKLPANLKLLKPGAGNVPADKILPTGRPLPVRAVRVSPTGWVAEGTDGGIVRIFHS